MQTFIDYTINQAGLAEIAEFLRENHKTGERIADDRKMLAAWAQDAETNLSNGNDARIEIVSWDSVHGYTQTFTVSDAGIDAATVNID